MTKSLTDSEKETFSKSVMYLSMGGMSLMEMARSDSKLIQMKMMAELNGKTVSQVIAKAEVLRNEKLMARKHREKEQAAEEIKELETSHKMSTAAAKELAKFRVIKSRYYKKKVSELIAMEEPVIELSVQNGTSKPVSRVYFRGTLSSPGRTIPWLKDSFNYEISGGLEPGEKADWALAPNMFSNWGKVKMKPGMVFTVEAYRIDGADGKALFTNDWNEKKATRLSELKAEFKAH
jgi:hypothetical protein